MVTSSPVKYGRGALCQAVVFRDVTRLKEREEDLTTLKGLLSRVFRHNIRNELTKLIGRAELIRESGGDPDGHVGHILETCRKLQSHSDKARLAERVIDEEGRRVEQSLGTALERAIADIADEYPDATVEVSLPEPVTVLANPHLGAALYNVIENAIVHTPDQAPTVNVTARAESDVAVIEVTDDGPGIPEREISALEGEAETALDHGSGVGLWLVNLVVEKSRGHLDIVGGPDGTTVRIRLVSGSTLAHGGEDEQRGGRVPAPEKEPGGDADDEDGGEQTRLPTD
jgi:signal transduction histidine kinase